MDTPRIRLGHSKNEPAPPNTFPDFDWVREHRAELYEEYGTCVILVYQKKVIGKGHTVQEAAEDAERNLPPDVNQVTPILEFVRHPYAFLRLRVKPNR
jgi:hypothetical protein